MTTTEIAVSSTPRVAHWRNPHLGEDTECIQSDAAVLVELPLYLLEMRCGDLKELLVGSFFLLRAFLVLTNVLSLH